jgi:hypothetical protein
MTDRPEPLELALRAALEQLDAVPDDVLRAAREAWTWRTIDDELARLAFDSAIEAASAGVRSAGGPRALTFEAAGVVVDVEVTEQGDRRRVSGQLAVPGGERVDLELQTPGASVPLDADALGRFVHADLPSGPVRFRCSFGPVEATGADAASPSDPLRPRPSVTTEWVVI